MLQAWSQVRRKLFGGFPRDERGRHLGVPPAYWSVPHDKLLSALHSGNDGLSSVAAARRLKRYGPNTVGEIAHLSGFRLFLRQFASPLVIILVLAAAIASVLKDWTNSIIILLIVFGSGVLSFIQEYRASGAVEKLRAQVRIACAVVRAGRTEVIPSRNVVPGDIVILSAGNLIPADGVLLEAKDFFVSQAVLTGESFATEKAPGTAVESASLAERTNCVFMGTSVGSGTAEECARRTHRGSEHFQMEPRFARRVESAQFRDGANG